MKLLYFDRDGRMNVMPEMAIRDVKAQRKRILRVLKPFVNERWDTWHTKAQFDALAKLYKDLGGK